MSRIGKLLLVFVALCAVLIASAAVAQKEDSPDPYANETPAQRDARMKWWREARFGMFIHWGVYSVPAGIYHGKQIGGIGEWIMNTAKIPCAEYQAFAKQFNPVKYNADQWVKTARDAGMKYIVITSKHHDGFAMFLSKASDWNIVKATPFKRDPLKELAAACKKYGIRLGFYYSQAQDWNNPGGAAIGGKWDKAQDGSMDDYIKNVAVPQVKEILSNYGKISVLWWDTPADMNKERTDQLIPLLKLQPGIIHNNRLGVYSGDTETPEQFVPATGFPGRDWETCMTMNDTWGYKSYDNNWKSTETLVRNLIDIASKGGNYLLNVGPTSEGLMPAPSVERLKEIGAWMKINGTAIYGTTASPFKMLTWGRCTKKATASGTMLYLHVFNWPADGKLLVPGLRNAATSASLLGTRLALQTEIGPDGVTIHVPEKRLSTISTTVVLFAPGALQVENPVLGQAADGSITLKASEAQLHGSPLMYEGGEDHDNLGYWVDASNYADWEFKVAKPGRFAVTADVATMGTSNFEISLDGKTLKGAAPNTGNYTTFETIDLGEMEISGTGVMKLAVKPIADGWNPVNLRAIHFKPLP